MFKVGDRVRIVLDKFVNHDNLEDSGCMGMFGTVVSCDDRINVKVDNLASLHDTLGFDEDELELVK